MAHDTFLHLGQALKDREKLGYDEAWSMPAAYYTDPAVLDIERERLFGKEWICLGRADELPEPGDYLAFQLCDEPLIAIRPDGFGAADVVAWVDRMIAAMTAEPGVRVPGDRRHANRRQNEAGGVAVDAALMDQLIALGADAGLNRA